ncbi:MAG: OmpA family protein [Gammaproteobacteria bacterium]
MKLYFIIGLLWLAAHSLAIAQDGPQRIVVVPFFEESGATVSSQSQSHYRRVLRFINNQLARSGFEVINAFAAGYSDADYRRLMARARNDSAAAAMDLNRRFGTDLSYVVWLQARTQRTSDGLCRARVRLEGEGYDSAGRDLGAGISEEISLTRQNCDDAVVEAETELADRVGRTLAPHRGSAPLVSADTITEALVTHDRTDAPPTIDIVINFAFDSARIQSSSEAQLRQLASALQTPALRGAQISIEGHTDSIGSAAYNCKLSMRRANAVKQELVQRYGIDGRRLLTSGFGEALPVESNATELGRAFNRRVSFVNFDNVDPRWLARRNSQACR